MQFTKIKFQPAHSLNFFDFPNQYCWINTTMRMAKTGLKCANVQKSNWKLNGCVIYLLASKILFNLADSCCSTVSHSVSHHNFLFHNCHQDTYFDFSRNESGLTRFIYSLYKVNSSCRMYVFVLVSWSWTVEKHSNQLGIHSWVIDNS